MDCVTTVVDRSDTCAALFAIFRHERQGLVDDEMRRRAGLIAPHVRRAVMIGRAIDRGQSETDTFANVLDSLAAGVIFVAPNCRITHTNKSAREMLASGDVLRVSRDRLTSNDPACNQMLIDVIGAASRGDAALDASGISMPLAGHDGDDYVAHVLPLTSGLRHEASAAYAASAAIFVQKPNRKTVAAPEAMAKAFGLTPTELRIFLGVVEIGGAPEVAEAFGVSVNTVKSHLQRIFPRPARAGRRISPNCFTDLRARSRTNGQVAARSASLSSRWVIEEPPAEMSFVAYRTWGPRWTRLKSSQLQLAQSTMRRLIPRFGARRLPAACNS